MWGRKRRGGGKRGRGHREEGQRKPEEENRREEVREGQCGVRRRGEVGREGESIGGASTS